jgi:hypothetical protein
MKVILGNSGEKIALVGICIRPQPGLEIFSSSSWRIKPNLLDRYKRE